MPRTDFDELYSPTGQLLSRAQRVVSDEQIRREGSSVRLLNAVPVLRQWKTDAEVVANQGANVTQAQQKALFGRFATLCDRLADLLEIRV